MLADGALHGTWCLRFLHAGGGASCSQPGAGLLASSSPGGAEQDLGSRSSLLLLGPFPSPFPLPLSHGQHPAGQQKAGCKKQGDCQQFSSCANHSLVEKSFTGHGNSKTQLWMQRARVVLLSPYFLGPSSFSTKNSDREEREREERLINTLRQAFQRLGLQSPSFTASFHQPDY